MNAKDRKRKNEEKEVEKKRKKEEKKESKKRNREENEEDRDAEVERRLGRDEANAGQQNPPPLGSRQEPEDEEMGGIRARLQA